MPSQLANPLLQQTEDTIEHNLSVSPENLDNFNKIVVSGLHIALDKGANGFMASLAQSADPVADAAKGAISLVLIMRKDARGVMPLKAAVPAAMSLMLHALDFIDRSKIAPVGNPELVRATHIFADFMFARMGITKAGLANAAQKVHRITADPQSMAAINLKAGLTRHPMAATPTPLPPGPSGRGSLMNGAAMASGTA
jgi:hypothetical protein